MNDGTRNEAAMNLEAQNAGCVDIEAQRRAEEIARIIEELGSLHGKCVRYPGGRQALNTPSTVGFEEVPHFARYVKGAYERAVKAGRLSEDDPNVDLALRLATCLGDSAHCVESIVQDGNGKSLYLDAARALWSLSELFPWVRTVKGGKFGEELGF